MAAIRRECRAAERGHIDHGAHGVAARTASSSLPCGVAMMPGLTETTPPPRRPNCSAAASTRTWTSRFATTYAIAASRRPGRAPPASADPPSVSSPAVAARRREVSRTRAMSRCTRDGAGPHERFERVEHPGGTEKSTATICAGRLRRATDRRCARCNGRTESRRLCERGDIAGDGRPCGPGAHRTRRRAACPQSPARFASGSRRARPRIRSPSDGRWPAPYRPRR